jgi:hypothetical protein
VLSVDEAALRADQLAAETELVSQWSAVLSQALASGDLRDAAAAAAIVHSWLGRHADELGRLHAGLDELAGGADGAASGVR